MVPSSILRTETTSRASRYAQLCDTVSLYVTSDRWSAECLVSETERMFRGENGFMRDGNQIYWSTSGTYTPMWRHPHQERLLSICRGAWLPFGSRLPLDSSGYRAAFPPVPHPHLHSPPLRLSAFSNRTIHLDSFNLRAWLACSLSTNRLTCAALRSPRSPRPDFDITLLHQTPFSVPPHRRLHVRIRPILTHRHQHHSFVPP